MSRSALRRSAKVAAIVASGLTSAGCDRSSAAAEDDLRLEIVLDVGARRSLPSIVNFAYLLVSAADGQVDSVGRTLTPAETTISMTVTVPQGSVRFTASAITVNDSIVLRGETTAQIGPDPFNVDIDLQAVGPIMDVSPTALSVSASGPPRTFAVANVGADGLQWSVSDVTPPVTSCPVAPCFSISPSSGTVARGDTALVTISQVATAGVSFAINFSSPQGDQAVDLDVPALPGLRIVPAPVRLYGPGLTQQLDVFDEQGNRVTLPKTWISADTSVVLVDATGRVTSTGIGRAPVTVSVNGGGTASTDVEVADPVVMVDSLEYRMACALVNYIVGAGLLGDELSDAQSSSVFWDFDRRTTTSGGVASQWGCDDPSGGVYQPLLRVHALADTLNLVSPQPPTLQRAIVELYGGYSLLLLGEGMCSADVGVGPQDPTSLWGSAVARFSTAVALATQAGNADVAQAAAVGRARANVNLGDYASALADVARVPPGWSFQMSYAAQPSMRNHIFDRVNSTGEVTIEDDFRNLSFASVADPRVPVVDTRQLGADGVTPLWIQTKHNAPTDSISLASWEEATLIMAEGAARSGDFASATAHINQLHAGANLPGFSGSSGGAVTAHVAQEYQRQLFLEGQHLAVKRRFGLPFTPASGAPFKTAGSYGTQTCFPS